MDRRRFLKMGISASGAMAASAFLPLVALAKGGNQDAEMQDLLATVGYEGHPLCREHDSCVVIDPGIFARNIATLRKDMGPDVKVCVVMKSDAYGHGVENLVAEAVKARPEYIGLVENREIRKAMEWMDKAGMRATILRIAPATFYEAAESVVKGWPVEEVVGSPPQAEMLSRLALWVGKKRGRPFSIPVHINIDTGMGRMGFERVEDIKKTMALPGIKVRGIMTHFANAYDPKRGEELTREQMKLFDAKLSKLDFDDDVIIHTANSGAALRFPWTRRSMVRVGGALYGDIPTEMNPGNRYPRVARSFRSSVVWIMHDVPPGTPVGYESVYHTPKGRPVTLATVKVGYNNGVPSWAYQKGTEMLIRGKRFPVVGKTSMNMVVVDVTAQNPKDPVRLDDEVVIFGSQGDQTITLYDLEETTDVPDCEIFLDIGNDNPRVVMTGK